MVEKGKRGEGGAMDNDKWHGVVIVGEREMLGERKLEKEKSGDLMTVDRTCSD